VTFQQTCGCSDQTIPNRGRTQRMMDRQRQLDPAPPPTTTHRSVDRARDSSRRACQPGVKRRVHVVAAVVAGDIPAASLNQDP